MFFLDKVITSTGLAVTWGLGLGCLCLNSGNLRLTSAMVTIELMSMEISLERVILAGVGKDKGFILTIIGGLLEDRHPVILLTGMVSTWRMNTGRDGTKQY